MKGRIFKHWFMSAIGIIIWLITLTLFIISKLDLKEGAHELSLLEIVALLLLGWIFFVGKTSLLNGLSAGIFKKLGWMNDPDD